MSKFFEIGGSIFAGLTMAFAAAVLFLPWFFYN